MNETITITDHATPELQRRIAALKDRQPLMRAMGLAVEKRVALNFTAVKMPQGNYLHGPSTGFWQEAASSVQVTATGDEAVIAVRKKGVRLQWLGGTVRPGDGKHWLTIPARSETHGKTADAVEGGYENQEWLYGRNGPYAIASKASGVVLFWLKKEATIKPHADVLPKNEEMAKAAVKAAEGFLNRGGAR